MFFCKTRITTLIIVQKEVFLLVCTPSQIIVWVVCFHVFLQYQMYMKRIFSVYKQYYNDRWFQLHPNPSSGTYCWNLLVICRIHNSRHMETRNNVSCFIKLFSVILVPLCGFGDEIVNGAFPILCRCLWHGFFLWSTILGYTATFIANIFPK